MITEVKVVHSSSKPAWNVIGVCPGGRYKWARFPYVENTGSEICNTREKAEALDLAEYFAWCVNHRDEIEHTFKSVRGRW